MYQEREIEKGVIDSKKVQKTKDKICYNNMRSNIISTDHWAQNPRGLSYPLWNYSIKEMKRLCAKGRCAVFKVFALWMSEYGAFFVMEGVEDN